MQCKVVVRTNSFWKNLRDRMRDITTHSAFDAVIVVLILLNTIVLALYHHGIDPKFRQVLDYVNLVSRPRIPGFKSPLFFYNIGKSISIKICDNYANSTIPCLIPISP